MPTTSVSRPGVFSITSSVSLPNFSTIRFAIDGPMPWIKPEPKNRSMPTTVFGVRGCANDTLNWRPYFLSTTHWPTTVIGMPSLISTSLPTIVIGSPLSVVKRATV
jgi:hypothetical protein